MQLHCLGTAGYHPNHRRHTSCYFLPESGILLDAGTGIFRLAKHLQTSHLDILLSHAHLDHTFGLTTLLDVLHQRPVERVTVWGQAAKLDAIRDHLFSDLIFPAPIDCQWKSLDKHDQIRLGDAEITWRPQTHPGGSLAYRIDWLQAQKRLVYATDTTGDLSDEHAVWSRRADLLMHECYFTDKDADWAEKTGHSWTQRVAEVASKSSPQKLLLTHVNPLNYSDDPTDIEKIRARVDSEVLLAEDELRVDF